MKRILAAALLIALGTPALAEGSGAFAPFLSPDSKECVPVSAIEKVAKSTKALKTPTMRFVQALYVAVPPISKKLPPGDSAELSIGPDGEVIVFLIDDRMSCARMLSPPFITEMIQQVDDGAFIHAGTKS